MKKTAFAFRMSKEELFCGLVFLPVFIFLLPLFVTITAEYIKPDINGESISVIFYLACFIMSFLVFRRFLKISFSEFLDAKFTAVYSVVSGFILYYILSYAVSIVMYISGAIPGSDDYEVLSMISDNRNVISAAMIMLAPMTEEILFRGVIYGSLCRKSRILAFAVSFVFFSIYHMWDYLLMGFSSQLALMLIVYIPVSVSLCWSYEKTASIWSPIFLHMLINAYTLQLLK